ncbi:hypothetical protein KBD61_00820 [Patescibacteria group bacterium]|nr:hypothetical protein [Patescibacteria group bacterium]MBP9709550.1 hypothetical protein [Patescibacteria group bacterium]
MPNHEEKQDLLPSSARLGKRGEPSSARLHYFFRTRKRTFLVGMGVGLVIALVFLVLSLKVADPVLQYNPYRWISKPHEWLMLVGLLVEAKLLLLITKVPATLPQLLALVSLAHVLAAMVVYGVLVVLVREVILFVKKFRAKR